MQPIVALLIFMTAALLRPNGKKMRKKKIVELEPGKKITVSELTIRQLLDLQDRISCLGDSQINLRSLQSLVAELLPHCTDIVGTDIFEYAPSELEELGKAFWEVNQSFLKILDLLGVKEKMIKAIQQDLQSIQNPAS